MFSLMGNCCSCIRRKRQPKRPVTLAILGLDSAGKSTTTKALLAEGLDTAPTIGFNKEELEYANFSIVLYDLGGGQKIRGIWKDYLNEIFGVIYVVDSSVRERMGEVKDNFWNLIGHEMVRSKPVLVLANKEDIDGHMDEVELVQQLQLEDLVNINKCPCKMVMCSAIKGTGKKMDPNIGVGMTWLCSMLDQQYDTLKIRIDRDVEIMDQKRQKEREERKERVKKQREERERLEEEENKRLGIKKEEIDEDDEDIVDGSVNPFRRLDNDEIQRKETQMRLVKEKEKEKKKRLKELEQENINPAFTPDNTANTVSSYRQDNNDDDGFHVPRSSRSLGSYGLLNGAPLHKIGSDEEGDSDATIPRSGRQLLPPLQSPRGTKFVEGSSSNTKDKKKKKKQKQKGGTIEEYGEYSNDSQVHENDNYGQSTMSVSKIEVISNTIDEDSEYSDRNLNGREKYLRDTSPRSTDSGRKKRGKNKSQEDENGFDTLRLSQHLDDVDDDIPNGGSISPVKNSYSSSGSLTPVKKLKKKNKHLRKNKLAPSDDEFELSDVQTPKKKPIPWTRSNSPMKMLNTVEDNHAKESQWGFAEELSAMDGNEPLRMSRSNYDTDDPIL